MCVPLPADPAVSADVADPDGVGAGLGTAPVFPGPTP